MISKTEIYERAFKIKEENANTNKQLYEKKYNELLNECEELRDIDSQINIKGSRLISIVMDGSEEDLATIRAEFQSLHSRKNQILNQHNFTQFGYNCPLCDDTGRVKGKICRCVNQIAAHVLIDAHSDYIDLTRYTFENFDISLYPDRAVDGINCRSRMSKTLEICREYVLGFEPGCGKNLYFCGGTGLGKSHLSAAMVNGLINRHYYALYMPSFNLFSRLTREYFNGEDTLFETVSKCDFLVIDDLGSEMNNSQVATLLYNLINNRIQSRRPFLINTNLKPDELKARYTERIFSRVFGSCEGRMFCGDDIRLQNIDK